ncbi:COQ9 family protein [Rickettsiaceae bacterium]|nr:COQ9 family protein [Rickettsiaceae bacterium]
MADIASKHAECRCKFFEALSEILETNSWSKKTIPEAEKKCDFASGYHHVLFPAGISQVISKFELWQDNKMLNLLNSVKRPGKIREKIALALEVRIMQILSKEAMFNVNAFFSTPSNILSGGKSAYATCDAIWRYAGDKSNDFNYYTKRGLLFSVYQSSKLFYFADNSKDHKDTKEFIKNALDNIVNIASFKSQVKTEDIPILRLFC